MRILSIGNFYNPSWDSSIPDEEHIAKSLEDLGHEVIRVQREEMLTNYPDVEFVLIAQWDGYQDSLLALLPHPVIYWAFDYQEVGQAWHQRLVATSDLYLSKPFKDSGYPNWQWLSQDFAPDFLEKHELVDQEIDVLFTGSWVPWESGKERVKWLKAIDKEFNLQINSVTPDQWKAEGFKNVQGPVMDNNLPSLVGSAKINFSQDHVLAPGYWSDRLAQTMCCGGFVLHRYVPMSETVFRDNIAYCYSIDDCLEKIKYYLEHDNEREEIAKRGYKYAHKYLTASARVKDLLTIVGGL